ncbi:32515_t:CDS:2, partial [Gigaspora margarita]
MELQIICSELNYWYRIVRQSELRLSEGKYNIRNYFLKADKQVNELPTQQSKIQASRLIDTQALKLLIQQRSKYIDFDADSGLIELLIPDIEIKMNSEENRDIEIEKKSKGSLDVKIEKKSETILDSESENKTEEITGNKNYEPVEEESVISIESSGNCISENRVDEVDEKKKRNHFNNTAYLLKQSVYKTREEQYEFFKTQFSNDKELNNHEKQYLLNALQGKFDKLKVKNNEGEMRLCKDCNKSVYAIEFCEFCIRKYLQRNFCKWTGNNEIDEAIQEAQLNTIAPDLVIEFIPYESLNNIHFRTEGSYSTIYNALWIDGYFDKWNNERKILQRIGKYNVVLKRLRKKSNQLDRSWFNEITSHFIIDKVGNYIVRCFGITKDSNTEEFILVLDAMDYNLQEYLINNNSFYWKERIRIIYNLSNDLHEIHKAGSIHRDLHPCNILLRDSNVKIGDLGFCGSKSFSVKSMFGNDLYWSIPKSFSSGGKSWMLSLPELPTPRNFEKDFEGNEKLLKDSKINYFEPDRLYESTDAVTSHEEFRIYDIDETRQNTPNQYIITENFKRARSSIINNENGTLRIAEILYLIFDELHNEGFSEEDINEEIKRYIATIDKKSHNIFTWLCENQ